MIGIARAPGSCGELVQGRIDNTNFLVTCPVNVFSVVKVKLNTSGYLSVTDGFTKAREAVEKTLLFLGRPELGAEITVSSAIPWGKGMASSTADIAASCAATAEGLGAALTPGEIADIALSIEPSDGIMFQGIVLFDHIAGTARRKLGDAPPMDIIVVDLGGTVDTLTFNEKKELALLNSMKENRVSKALTKVERAFSTGNMNLLGEGATESAFANQQILYKPELEKLLEINKKTGGIGVNIAHSGTVIGLLYEKYCINCEEIEKLLLTEGFNPIFRSHMINGGLEILKKRTGETVWQPLDTFTEETYGRLQKNMG